MIESLLAFYFSLLLFAQDWPVLIGPYETSEECNAVREFADRRGYETDDCELMSQPQDSKFLEVVQIP